MTIGDIAVALQPEGGQPASSQTVSHRKNLTMALRPDPVTAHADVSELRERMLMRSTGYLCVPEASHRHCGGSLMFSLTVAV
jgi:hypothetical protein